MLRRLFFTAALLLLLPGAAQAQQASVRVYARVVERVETQRLVSVAEAGSSAQVGAVGAGMPASWRWEVRGAAVGDSQWTAPLLASGRGGAGWQPSAAARQPGAASYLFAPI